ncbi:transcriptional regulator [Mycobacteroides abscessus subsp. abscessus]|nr:hypothetical protein [Mycobacteroides abscessus]SHU98700.1 transcriptional regulator [Mycobacteroides abscessus subsp. abscessus]CPT98766.1 Possible transcriptional regulator [Mycobacteroides abscessus]CPZ60492.1 Possible transcriptional regulator [Mycobacteroides abscessus]CPZ78477.1 Possible transcriptional regulator [Mycobacteroides abscessus]
MTEPTVPFRGRRPDRREDSQVIRRRPLPPTPPPVSPPRQPGPPARRAQPPPTRTPRTRRWGLWIRRIVVFAMTLMLLGFCGVIGTALWLDGRLHHVDALKDYPDRPASGSGTNWLLVGSDSRQGLTPDQETQLATGGDIGDGRTDTILLVHIPAFYDGGAATMVSLPRDSYVSIPENGSNKLNAAYSLGGPALLTRTVEEATGLRIDHYAEIGFNGFASVVDAIGGVSMCLDEPIQDPLAGIDLTPGCQILNGPSALGYVRSRATPRADLDRMTHQRAFMSALFHRVSSPAVWANPFRWYPVATSTADAITLAEGDHSWNLAQLGWALAGSVQNLTMPIGSFSENWAGDIVTWDQDASSRLFDALRTGQQIPADLLPDPATPTP